MVKFALKATVMAIISQH